MLLYNNNIKKSKMTTGWCMKCKSKKEMKNVQNVTMKNGRPAMKGVCSSCGTKMFKIGDGSSSGSTKSKKSTK
jgi:Zn finger protein HypA/HybF involved in hydrogenase expression